MKDRALRNAQLVTNGSAVLASSTVQTQMPTDGSFVDPQEEIRYKRRRFTRQRWSREQTVFKCVNELTLLFECQIFLVIQHNGEDKKQIYHSRPERKNWPLSYADIVRNPIFHHHILDAANISSVNTITQCTSAAQRRCHLSKRRLNKPTLSKLKMSNQ